MDNRLKRTRSVSEPATATGVKKAKNRPPFKIKVNKGGFAPGVDPAKIKDIIFELEEEELLEKLRL